MGKRVSRTAAYLNGGYPVDRRLFQSAQRYCRGKQNGPQSPKEKTGEMVHVVHRQRRTLGTEG